MQHTSEHEMLIAGFAPWARSQPPEREYPYSDGGCCAFAQYLYEVGYNSALVSAETACLDTRRDGPPLRLGDHIAGALANHPHNFDSLVARLDDPRVTYGVSPYYSPASFFPMPAVRRELTPA